MIKKIVISVCHIKDDEVIESYSDFIQWSEDTPVLKKQAFILAKRLAVNICDVVRDRSGEK